MLTRRSMLMGAAALAAPAHRPSFFDGQSVVIGGAERVLTDIVAPSSAPLRGWAEPGAEIALGALAADAAHNFGDGARHFGSVEALVEALKPELAADVTVLVKGSRFMRMERVVQALTAHAQQNKEEQHAA